MIKGVRTLPPASDDIFLFEIIDVKNISVNGILVVANFISLEMPRSFVFGH